MRLVLACAVALALAAAGASAAQAEPRYAAPAGEGAACIASQPCLLEEAVTKAKTGDEVIVTAGSYTLSKPLLTPMGVENLDIHGAAGGPMPTIVAATSAAYALEFRAAGGRLSYLAVEDTAATFAWAVKCINGGRVERVRISATGSPSIGLLQGEDCVLRDSVVLAAGSQAQAILATGGSGVHSGLARNVTAVGTGSDSVGITSSYSGGEVVGSYTLDARNVIASGGGWDLRTSGGSFGVGHFQISNSNFETTNLMPGSTISGGANQTAPPLFVDPLGGDYHQAPGSPTIDAGVNDQLGPLDLDGNPRLLGAAPDIGAYEIAGPPAGPATTTTTPAAGVLTSLRVSPRKFHPAKAASVASCFQKYKDSIPGPRCASIEFELSGPGVATLRIERQLPGRRSGGKCRRPTPANTAKPRCARFRTLPGSLRPDGAGGAGRIAFSGWLAGRRLKAGSYRLLGEAGGAVKRAPFRITG
jgi:hypothetical protein